MLNFSQPEFDWREKLLIPNCTKTWEYDQNAKSRFHPITGKRLITPVDSPTSMVRVAYADAWGISIKDLHPYVVMKKYNLCHTEHCCNPLHWRVYPKPKFAGTVSRVPFWLLEAIKGERPCVKGKA